MILAVLLGEAEEQRWQLNGGSAGSILTEINC